jgi:hypothetical protein
VRGAPSNQRIWNPAVKWEDARRILAVDVLHLGCCFESRGAERGGLHTHLRPLELGFPTNPGHDGIRAPGSQSITATSMAKGVVGCHGAGPTSSAVTRRPLAAFGGNSLPSKRSFSRSGRRRAACGHTVGGDSRRPTRCDRPCWRPQSLTCCEAGSRRAWCARPHMIERVRRATAIWRSARSSLRACGNSFRS